MPVASDMRTMVSQSSMIRKMFDEGLILKAKYGEDNVFDFSLGNPDVEPPAEFHKQFVKMAGEDIAGSHSYMPNAGYQYVRDAIAKKVSKEHGVNISGNDVVMTVGAAGALNLVFKSILNFGDEIIIISPYFVDYLNYIKNHNGKPVIVDSLPDFNLDIDAIERAITPKTAAILINSPNNPTGKIYPKETIDALSAMLLRKGAETGRAIYLVADEPYREIVYDGNIVPSPLSAYPHSIIATSYSKSLSLPGERIGYVAVNSTCDDKDTLVSAIIVSMRILGFVNAPALMQRLVALLTDVTVDVSLYERRRDIFAAGLRDAGFTFANPEGAFYIFCKAPIEDDVKFVNYLKQYRILSVPGSGFGGPGYFRLCYCVKDSVLEKSIPLFKEAMINFKK